MSGRVLGPALAALALTASLDAAAPDTQAAAPRIAVEPPSFDFGKALANRTLTKEFSVRNFGTADLHLEKVSTDCGCTVASGFTDVIAPGGSTPLRVSLQTRNASGRIVKRVLLRSDDPDRRLLEVKVSATVVAGK